MEIRAGWAYDSRPDLEGREPCICGLHRLPLTQHDPRPVGPPELGSEGPETNPPSTDGALPHIRVLPLPSLRTHKHFPHPPPHSHAAGLSVLPGFASGRRLGAADGSRYRAAKSHRSPRLPKRLGPEEKKKEEGRCAAREIGSSRPEGTWEKASPSAGKKGSAARKDSSQTRRGRYAPGPALFRFYLRLFLLDQAFGAQFS